MYNYANSHSWRTSAKCGVPFVSSVVPLVSRPLVGECGIQDRQESVVPPLDKVGRLYQRHTVSKTWHIEAYLATCGIQDRQQGDGRQDTHLLAADKTGIYLRPQKDARHKAGIKEMAWRLHVP